jgi:hypothetical protein
MLAEMFGYGILLLFPEELTDERCILRNTHSTPDSETVPVCDVYQGLNSRPL